MKHYLSGPISAMPDGNRKSFEIAAAMLRERGYDIVNPIEFDESPGLPWSDYLRKDIRALMDCHGVITLPGWRHETTARISAGRGTGTRTEVVWLNPACSAALARSRGGLFEAAAA